jgi:hypothetical protein
LKWLRVGEFDRPTGLKNYCHSVRYFVRSLDYARDDNLRGDALKNYCHSERRCMRPLGGARDDNLRGDALKKSLSFRTVFREESHRVKQRSTKLLLVTLGGKTLCQLNRKSLSSRCNRMRSLDYARDDNLRDGALKNYCHSERRCMRFADCARDDNLRDGALKKPLSFRTVFREESHRVKLRSTKRLLVTLGEKTLCQLNRKHFLPDATG